jgi:hypothetical protein
MPDAPDRASGPQVTFLDAPGAEPGANEDVKLKVSLNGKLILVHRGERKEGDEGPLATELYGLNWEEFDQLTGRLLTLCDATFTDPVQRKAFKDMVRQHIKEWVTACIVNASADAGIKMSLTAPFVGGVFDDPERFWGVEGQPTQ